MKVLVVGTSNSIERGGWFFGFSDACEAAGHVAKRISLGGSPFIQFLAFLPEIAEQAPDHIVLDCSSNDEVLWSYIGDDAFFNGYYRLLLESLRCIAPVTVLRIPPEVTLRGDPPPISLRQQAICEHVGCTYIDAASYILELAGDAAPYRDRHHPQREISYQVGQTLAERIGDSGCAVPTLPSRELVNFAPSIHTINLDRPGGETTEIRTSLLSEEFSLLRPGHASELPPGLLMLGIFVDTGATLGALRFYGAGERREIMCLFDPDKSKNVKRYIPIHSGVRASHVQSVALHAVRDFAMHSNLVTAEQQIAAGDLLGIDAEQAREALAGFDLDCPGATPNSPAAVL